MQSIGTWMLGARATGELNIGRQGENLVAFLTLDAKQYISAYGDGTIQVRHLRSGDASPYPVSELERKGDQFIWTITSGDTAMVGEGLLEVRWYVGDALKISQTRKTRVEQTMQEDSTIPPNVWDGYLDRIHRSGAAVEAAAQEAIRQFDETVDQTTKDTVALVEKTGSNQVSNVKAQEKKSLQAVKELTAESKQTLETLRSDGVSALQQQEASSMELLSKQETDGLDAIGQKTADGITSVNDLSAAKLKAIQDTSAERLQEIQNAGDSGVKCVSDKSAEGLRKLENKISSGEKAIAEETDASIKAVSDTSDAGVKAVSDTANAGVSAVQQNTEAGISAVQAQERVSVDKVMELGEGYLEQARQAALSNGYAAFDVDEEGNAWLVRTTNIADKLDFTITDEGELEVIILG